jgi:hypothetical protein
MAIRARSPPSSSRPGTNEFWVGDVGWNIWEEVNRLTSPMTLTNFGWPCYEGGSIQSSYDAATSTRASRCTQRAP